MPAHRFQAVLGEPGSGRPLIEIPFNLKAEFGKARAPVVVRVNGVDLQTTVAVYGGRSYVGLRREIREAAGVELGDTIGVEIEADTTERTVDVPDDFAAALRAAGLPEAFDGLSFSHRHEHVEAIADAKRPETRRRRIERAVEMLSGP